MHSEFLNDISVFIHPFRVTVQNVADLIHKSLGLASLKDAKSGKYLLTNEFETEFSGLTPDELVGLTADDLNVGLFRGSRPALVKAIKKMDESVKTHRSPVLLKEIWVMHDGVIKARNLIKMPIIGHNNKVVAIFAYDEDLTPRLNLFDLFSLYKQYYNLPKQAIQQFLAYFKVKNCFQEIPTRTELIVIMAMSLDNRHKKVATLLNLSPKTISAHSFSIHQKLKPGIDFYTVLNGIRNANKNTCSIEDWLTD